MKNKLTRGNVFVCTIAERIRERSDSRISFHWVGGYFCEIILKRSRMILAIDERMMYNE